MVMKFLLAAAFILVGASSAPAQQDFSKVEIKATKLADNFYTLEGSGGTIGARVTVGHQAVLHGCTIADDCLIGMGARILNGAVLEPECLVGAGALITEGKRFASGCLIVGSPARVVRQLTEAEKQALRVSAAHYAEKARRYSGQLRTV